LFLGIGGIDFDAGLIEFNLEGALVKRAILGAAKETFVVDDAAHRGSLTVGRSPWASASSPARSWMPPPLCACRG
jgi:hypothetical protein